MTKENWKQSYVLIGPPMVGKSLLAGRLSTKTGYPIINTDDIECLVEYERDGDLGPDKDLQEDFYNRCIEYMLWDLKSVDPNYKAKAETYAKEFVDMYNQYCNMLGGNLSSMYDVIDKYNNVMENMETTPIENIALVTAKAKEMIDIIMTKVNTPCIIDTPGSFGWRITDDMFGVANRLKLKNSPAKLNVDKMNKEIKSLLKDPQTILLYPGVDYDIRSGKSEMGKEYQLINDNVNNFYDNADLVITTNGVFNQPENKILRQRMWFDLDEIIAKEAIRNSGEIDNICDEIIDKMSDLDMLK